MRRYIHTHTGGASYFFTVALYDRTSRLLLDEVALLRDCVIRVRHAHPFRIDAMVVLPEHIHAIWTLPPSDGDYGMRWMLIKGCFTRSLAARGQDAGPLRGVHGERLVWQRRFWEHQIRDEHDYGRHVDYIHYNPVKHGWAQRAGVGRIRVSIGMCGRGCCRRIGGWRRAGVGGLGSDWGRPGLGFHPSLREERRLG